MFEGWFLLGLDIWAVQSDIKLEIFVLVLCIRKAFFMSMAVIVVLRDGDLLRLFMMFLGVCG